MSIPVSGLIGVGICLVTRMFVMLNNSRIGQE